MSTAVLASGIDIVKMTNKQLLIIIRPLKRKEDGALPSVKKVMLQKYEEWKMRPPPTFEDEEEVSFLTSNEEDITTDDNENSFLMAEEAAVANAMILLGLRQGEIRQV